MSDRDDAAAADRDDGVTDRADAREEDVDHADAGGDTGPATGRTSGATADSGRADRPADSAHEGTSPDGAGVTGPGADEAVEGPDDAVLADEPLGEPRQLDGKVRYQWLVGTTVAAAVGAVFATGFFQFFGGAVGVDLSGTLPFGASSTTLLVFGLAFLVFEGLAALRAVLLYRSWRYVVREDSLYLRRGVLTRVQTVAPYVRVQHIDTRRSPVERLLGLSSLVVYTAGSRGADVTIPGLTDDRAAELQERLERLAIASEEDDAV